MEIREVELLTGLDRENIRFYEREGMLSPPSKLVGLEEFSQEDVETLLKIKVLRNMHVSVSNLKKLIKGSVSLSMVLEL